MKGHSRYKRRSRHGYHARYYFNSIKYDYPQKQSRRLQQRLDARNQHHEIWCKYERELRSTDDKNHLLHQQKKHLLNQQKQHHLLLLFQKHRTIISLTFWEARSGSDF